MIARHLLLVSLFSAFASAQTAAQLEFFETKIRPVLVAKCNSCHNSKMRVAGLNLETSEGFHKGADSGVIVAPGDPDGVRLMKVLTYRNPIKMPPTGKLTDQQIADFRAWVEMGSPWPGGVHAAAVVPQAKSNEYKITDAQRRFWAFQTPKDPAPPEVKNKAWVSNPIDNFVLAKLEEKGIQPAPPASKLTLIRRATFDLTGLPPTPKEIDDFLADSSPQAYPKLIDRLLASPRYGERWGRHWLDIARYADSTGADEDIRYPYAYKYRDYVIESFNNDLPYNQFVKEQLAGDLLPAAKPGEVNTRGIVATGFLQVGLKLLAEQDKPKMVYDMVDEQLDATSRAFLSLTVACARCHDHKFDPIPTKDYYSMASIFASTKSLAKVEGTVSQLYYAPLVPKDVFEVYDEHQKKIKDRGIEIADIAAAEATRYAAVLRPKLGGYLLAANDYKTRPQSEESLCLEAFAAKRKLDSSVLERWIDFLEPTDEVRPYLTRWYNALKKDRAALEEAARQYGVDFEKSNGDWEQKLAKWRTELDAARKAGKHLPEKPNFDAGLNRFYASVMFDKRGPFYLPQEAQDAYYEPGHKSQVAALKQTVEELKKSSPPEPPMANAVTEGEFVQQKVFVRGNPENPGDEVPKQFLQIIAGSSQKPVEKGSGRLELADWLTDPNHPLTTRVIANRIWQYHFGEGIVRTASNFGRLGEMPTHPELLDYLSRRFVENGWSVKKMHRMIMLSSAYRMDSQISKQAIELDPSNRLFSRFNRRRLDVEEIRDGLLAIGGTLDPTVGGTLQSGFGTDGENSNARLSIDPATVKRRTVYLPLRRSNLPTVLNLFDFGDATTPGEGRSHTNVAPQALFMMNSAFVTDRAREVASQIEKAAGTPEERIQSAYRAVLNRPPAGEERAEWLRYMDALARKAADSRAALPDGGLYPWVSLSRLLMSSNEFIYVD